MQEVRLLKRRMDEAGMGNASAAAASSLPTEQEYTVVGTYECPKCNFTYPTMDSLNHHLDVCLTQHMFP